MLPTRGWLRGRSGFRLGLQECVLEQNPSPRTMQRNERIYGGINEWANEGGGAAGAGINHHHSSGTQTTLLPCLPFPHSHTLAPASPRFALLPLFSSASLPTVHSTPHPPEGRLLLLVDLAQHGDGEVGGPRGR